MMRRVSPIPAIELNDAEKALLDKIKFDMSTIRGPEDAARNGRAVRDLTKLLVARDAIPEVRLRYFGDPAYYPGGYGRSRRNDFERNGCCGDDILEHPHFLEFLRYFIYGADLPQHVIEGFQRAIADCGQVSSSDIVPLGKKARKLAREAGLTASESYEEFYKLALDCGLWHRNATHIRDVVRKMR